jgi:hypothetical protein
MSGSFCFENMAQKNGYPVLSTADTLLLRLFRENEAVTLLCLSTTRRQPLILLLCITIGFELTPRSVNEKLKVSPNKFTLSEAAFESP